MNLNQASDLLKAAWSQRANIAWCMLSEPGIGKTEITYQLCNWVRENTQYTESKVVEIIASQILPNEVSGITMPDKETESMMVYDHKRLSSLEDGDILFMDELLQGSPQVLSACLTLIQERRMMSGKKLPDIMIVAAANPTASPSMIPAAVRQRFMFIPVEFDYDLWEKYMMNEYNIPVSNDFQDILMNRNKELNNWNEISPRSMTKVIQLFVSMNPSDRTRLNQKLHDIYPGCSNILVTALRKTEENIKCQKTLQQENVIFEDIKEGLLGYIFNECFVGQEEFEEIQEEIKEIKDASDFLTYINKNFDDPNKILQYLNSIEIEVEEVICSTNSE